MGKVARKKERRGAVHPLAKLWTEVAVPALQATFKVWLSASVLNAMVSVSGLALSLAAEPPEGSIFPP